MDDFQTFVISEMSRQIAIKREEVIKDALKRNGIPDTDIRCLSVITTPFDPYEHLYYMYGTPYEIRVISIQKTEIIFKDHPIEITKNNFSITIECKYY